MPLSALVNFLCLETQKMSITAYLAPYRVVTFCLALPCLEIPPHFRRLPYSVWARTLLHCPRFNARGEIVLILSPNLNAYEVPSWLVVTIDENS